MPQLPFILFWTFWAIWLLLAIRPLDRPTWWLENITLFATVPFVIWAFRASLLSTISVIIIFAFALMHVAAAHYSYASTPWGNWAKRSFSLKRNHFDRLVHFLYGVLMVPVAADVFQYQLPPSGFVRGLFIFSVIAAFGSLYEIAEFIVASSLGKRGGLKWLGVQSDMWDTQKDMLMQSIGAAAMLIFLAFR